MSWKIMPPPMGQTMKKHHILLVQFIKTTRLALHPTLLEVDLVLN